MQDKLELTVLLFIESRTKIMLNMNAIHGEGVRNMHDVILSTVFL